MSCGQGGDEHIQASVKQMQAVIELARTIRERHTKPLKQPLRSLVVVHSDESFLADLYGELKQYVLEEVRPMSPWTQLVLEFQCPAHLTSRNQCMKSQQAWQGVFFCS